MKKWKTILVSLLLSACSTGVLYTQSAPKLALSINTGIGSAGLPVQLGLRGALRQRLSLNAQLGNAPWKFKQTRDQYIANNVKLKTLKIRGQEAYSIDLRAYTTPGHTGFYGGVGLQWQTVSIYTKTKLSTPSTSNVSSSGANSFAGFLLGGLFNALINSSSNKTIEQTEKHTIRALSFDGGYAHVLKDNTRLEFGLRVLSRDLGGKTYEVPTFEQPKVFKLDDIVDPADVAFEVRYIVPIL